MTNFVIYTDGSYRTSKNQMGIGVLWLSDGKEIMRYSKGLKGGTNNIAELTAIYIALRSIKKNIDSLEIISDSEYSIGVVSNPNWNPKKNRVLIEKIKEQLEKTQKLVKNPIKFTHTKGHQTDNSELTKFNNIVDKLAQNSSQILIN